MRLYLSPSFGLRLQFDNVLNELSINFITLLHAGRNADDKAERFYLYCVLKINASMPDLTFERVEKLNLLKNMISWPIFELPKWFLPI